MNFFFTQIIKDLIKLKEEEKNILKGDDMEKAIQLEKKPKGFLSWFKSKKDEKDIKSNSEINDMDNNEDINDLKKKITKLKNKIKELENTITKEKDNNINMKKRINELESELKVEKNNNLKLKEKYEKEKKLNDPVKEIMELISKLNKKDMENMKTKLNSSFLLSEENLINIIFTSFEEDFYFPISCKITEKFNTIENLLYKEYPELMKDNNYFKCNGKEINKKKSLAENKIRNSDIITLMTKV